LLACRKGRSFFTKTEKISEKILETWRFSLNRVKQSFKVVQCTLDEDVRLSCYEKLNESLVKPCGRPFCFVDASDESQFRVDKVHIVL